METTQRFSATVIYDTTTGMIANSHLGRVLPDGTYHHVAGLSAQAGQGIILLTPDQVDALGDEWVVIIDEQCYVDTQGDPTVRMRVPAEIHLSKDVVRGDGKDSCTVTATSKNVPISTTLECNGEDVACPVTGAVLAVRRDTCVRIAERKYMADDRNITIEEQ